MPDGSRDDLRAIYDAAVAAVDPLRLVSQVASARDGELTIAADDHSDAVLQAESVLRGRIGVLGAGKAAAGMAAALEAACCGTVDLAGAVVAPEASARPNLHRIQILVGEHPVPGRLGLASTARILSDLESSAADHYLCLLSGGASSLLVAPIPPLRLAEKQEVTRLLLECGAAIDEINRVRKHLSRVKGGRLLRLMGGRPVLTLIISDVVGDDPATVGSGPTVPDTSTYDDALAILRRHGVLDRSPEAVRDVLERGRRGEIEETVRPESTEARHARSLVIGSNATAQRAAADAARRLGYRVHVRERPLVGDTTVAARAWFAQIEQSLHAGEPTCLIAGGETTVRVRGDGKGGRNQEFALTLVESLAGLPVALLSAGTDGIDGPTDAAGAFADGGSLARAVDRGLSPSQSLEFNDSYHFFKGLGDLFAPGASGTNVMDLKIALIGPPSAA